MILKSKVTVLAQEFAVSVTSLPRKLSRSSPNNLVSFVGSDLLTLKAKVEEVAEEAFKVNVMT